MYTIEDKAMLMPAVCLICEEKPEPGTMVIDTFRDFHVKGYGPEGGNLNTHLSGRKYICKACAEQMAKQFDYSSPEHVEDLTGRLMEALEELARVKAETADAVRLADALAAYADED